MSMMQNICSISHRTIRVLLYQAIDAVVCLGIMLIFLIEQSQTELRLEIARNKYQKILIIETCKVITEQLLIDKGTIEQTGDTGIVQKEYLIKIILGILPLLQLYIPSSLFQSQIDASACVDCGACESACPTGAISAE